MPSARDTVFERILEVPITVNKLSNTTAVSGTIKYFRGRQYLDANDYFDVPYSGGAAGANTEVVLSTVIPPFGVLRIVGTYV